MKVHQSISPSVGRAISCFALGVTMFALPVSAQSEPIFEPAQPARAINPTDYEDQNWFERRLIDMFICGTAYRNRLCAQVSEELVYKWTDSTGSACCGLPYNYSRSKGTTQEFSHTAAAGVGCATYGWTSSISVTRSVDEGTTVPGSPCWCASIELRQRVRVTYSTREYVPVSPNSCNYEWSYIRYREETPIGGYEIRPIYTKPATGPCSGCTGNELSPQPNGSTTVQPIGAVLPQLRIDLTEVFSRIDAGPQNVLEFSPFEARMIVATILSAMQEFGLTRDQSSVRITISPTTTLVGTTGLVIDSLFKHCRNIVRDQSFGDFDSDGTRTVLDLQRLQDVISGAVVERGQNRRYDMNCDGVVDDYDVEYWILAAIP